MSTTLCSRIRGLANYWLLSCGREETVSNCYFNDPHCLSSGEEGERFGCWCFARVKEEGTIFAYLGKEKRQWEHGGVLD